MVIDEVNTIPFFTPMWAHIPVFMMIFQLAREVWWYESPLPISALGYVLEPMYLRQYRHTPVFTISPSTEKDLRSLGFKGPITIIPIGIERSDSASRPKSKTPTFLYVGRLAPSKRLGHILRALAQFRIAAGEGRVWLVGSGSKRYRRQLDKLARRLGVEENVVFWGQVSTPEKHRLMAEAHALLMTSVREGWGLVVTEASARGTPAIVYDVPGLRDSVRHEATGLVVRPDPTNMTRAMIRLVSDRRLYSRLSAEGKSWSDKFSFDESARLVARTLDGGSAA